MRRYVKRHKNDQADAEAICEAVQRPTMRFVPIKSVEQQGTLVIHRVREPNRIVSPSSATNTSALVPSIFSVTTTSRLRRGIFGNGSNGNGPSIGADVSNLLIV